MTRAAATKAQDAFEDFLARYPNSEKAAQAQDNLKALQNRENSGSVQIAKYYDKKKNYKAAVIYYNEVIKEQPGTPDAKAAQARIDEMKAQGGGHGAGSRTGEGCRPGRCAAAAPAAGAGGHGVARGLRGAAGCAAHAGAAARGDRAGQASAAELPG